VAAEAARGVSALLLAAIVVLLLAGVTSRYVFSRPVIWIDEVVSISFLWLAMLGSAIALHRHEHLRLTVFLVMLPERLQGFVRAVGLAVIAASCSSWCARRSST
jgi:TRAP-type C4-dicarboxylate transport system permease small subunit